MQRCTVDDILHIYIVFEFTWYYFFMYANSIQPNLSVWLSTGFLQVVLLHVGVRPPHLMLVVCWRSDSWRAPCLRFSSSWKSILQELPDCLTTLCFPGREEATDTSPNTGRGGSSICTKCTIMDTTFSLHNTISCPLHFIGSSTRHHWLRSAKQKVLFLCTNKILGVFHFIWVVIAVAIHSL